MLDVKALLSKLINRELRKVDISTGSTTAGTIQMISMQIAYNDSIAIISGRIGISGLGANVRPSLTITVPSDMPTVDIIGASTIRGSAGSTQPSDPPHLTHTLGSTSASINFYNYIGQAPAGYLEATF